MCADVRGVSLSLISPQLFTAFPTLVAIKQRANYRMCLNKEEGMGKVPCSPEVMPIAASDTQQTLTFITLPSPTADTLTAQKM